MNFPRFVPCSKGSMLVLALSLCAGALLAAWQPVEAPWMLAALAAVTALSVRGIAGRGGLGSVCVGGVLIGAALAPPSPSPPLDIQAGLYRVHAEHVSQDWLAAGPVARMTIVSSASLVMGGRLPEGALLVIDGLIARRGRASYLVRVSPSLSLGEPRWPWRRRCLWATIVAEAEPGTADLSLRDKVRREISAALGRTLNGSSAALARALVLGQRDDLSSDQTQDVRAAGLAHLLAISGLHVGMALLLVFPLASMVSRRVFVCPPRLRLSLPYLVCLPLPASVALLSGDAPSAWRAAIVLTLALAVRAVQRRFHPYRLLAFAFSILLAASPQAGLSVASALSFLGTAAILSVAIPSTRIDRIWVVPVSSLRPLLMTMPLTAFVFAEVAPAALASNIVLGFPFAFVQLPAVWLHALWATASLPGTEYSGELLRVAAHVGFELCSAVERSFGLWSVPWLNLSGAIGLGCICLAGLIPGRWWQSLALCSLGVGALWANSFAASPSVGEMRLRSVPVGQGDAHIVAMPDSRVVLVDVGPGGRRSHLVLEEAVRAMGFEAIDIVAITHAHPDHWGGLAELARAFPIRELWLPDPLESKGASGLGRLARQLESNGVRLRGAPELCEISPMVFGSAEMRLISPCGPLADNWSENDRSLALLISMAGRDYLLTGDIEASAEAALLESYPGLQVDVLKVAHHGSRTSTGSAFLASVAPRLAIISCGISNRFGHPHREVMRRLRHLGVGVLRTDRDAQWEIHQLGADIRVVRASR